MNEAQLVLFDYEALDAGTRVFVETRTAEIKTLIKRSAQDIIEIGQYVSEVKSRLRHGQYGAWLKTEFDWSQDTASNFVRVFEKFRNFRNLDGFASSALYLLAAPSVPQEALLEAIDRADAGERVTYTDAKEIISQYKEGQPLIDESAPRITNSLGSYRQLPYDTKQCEKCGNLWAADLDYCPYCHIKPEVRAHYAAQEQTTPHVAHNSGNNEWYTPQDFVEAARLTLGTIELDPATSHEANGTVCAENIYTIDDDGLVQEWRGKVWMNPPYASDLVGRFIDKLISHHEKGDVPEAIVLVNNATETQWFQSLARSAKAICFPERRIRFWSPNGGIGSPLQGQAILYLGKDADPFFENFCYFGLLVKVT